MIVYETADGQLWTYEGLYNQFLKGKREDHDPASGPFFGNAYVFNEYADWLIEAINTGVVKEREVRS